jgi:hypothetical protein
LTALFHLLQAVLPQALGGFIVFAGVLAAWTYRKAALREFGERFVRFSRRRTVWILLAALLGPGLRLAVIPWFPLIDPIISDEFVHMLVADTLLEGRLANPEHLFAPHFETAHVLSYPTYAAKYPIGQGALLAIGKRFTGNYWFGVWLGMVLCCAAVALCLYCWLPPPPAAVGAILFSLRFGLDTYWINTHWGGGAAAAGGALALAALPALLRSGSQKAAIAAIGGWGVAWLIRPWESVPLGIVVAAVVLWRAGKRWDTRVGARLRRGVGILAAGALLVMGITGLHNYRVTGSPLQFPFMEYERQYGADLGLGFAWHAGEGALPMAPQRARFHPQVEGEPSTYAELAQRFARDYAGVWMFYLGAPLALPFFVGCWWSVRRRRYRLLPALLVFAFLWTLVYPEARPHYIAPYAGLIVLLAVLGLARMSRWDWRRAPLGLAVAAACVFVAVLPAISMQGSRRALAGAADKTPRQEIVRNLLREGGEHLVFVRYSNNTRRHYEWIYNTADIDAAPIIWALDLGEANLELINHYPQRRRWLVEPDVSEELRPLQ